jgi:ubiquinone biosynthesis protein Coq4
VWRHDLHQIATGYGTSLIGETEIGAWELGSGCGRYYVAWVLNAAAVAIGLFIAPRRVWRAFTRGRQSGSLYKLNVDERCLEDTVGALRRSLRIAVCSSPDDERMPQTRAPQATDAHH